MDGLTFYRKHYLIKVENGMAFMAYTKKEIGNYGHTTMALRHHGENKTLGILGK